MNLTDIMKLASTLNTPEKKKEMGDGAKHYVRLFLIHGHMINNRENLGSNFDLAAGHAEEYADKFLARYVGVTKVAEETTKMVSPFKSE